MVPITVTRPTSNGPMGETAVFSLLGLPCKYHKLSDLTEVYSLIALEVRSPKSKARALSEGSKRQSVPCFSLGFCRCWQSLAFAHITLIFVIT